MVRKFWFGPGSIVFALLVGSLVASATPPPRRGVRWPDAYLSRVRRQPGAFTTSRGFIQLTRRIQANRAAVRSGAMTPDAARAQGGMLVSGTKSIPVLTAKFNNTASDPYAVAQLQRELFDGPFPTGTMTDYYREISYGQLTVNGTVFPWKKVAQNDTFYEGGCNGLCDQARVGDLLRETLNLNDPTVNFASYDNDGPDGVPNSGDDDGFVDFVAFVQPESGGECGTSNIWSHRWILSGWGGGDFTTQDARAGGGFIKVDDYVIMPAFACDGTTLIQIGVFAHEFGHAFGLPDLYDTDSNNGDSEGIGNWCLMAGGGWGGDSQSPERPTHMSAWAKEFLGWITPSEVTSDLDPATLASIEDNRSAFKIPISPTEHYLISNRQKKLFDINLPGAGLLIWRINQTVITTGLASNTVNADENNKGVGLEEADGRRDLDNASNRADDGDPFRGSTGKRSFDNSTTPRSRGSIAVCDIGVSESPMTADLLVSTGRCPGDGGGGGGTCSSLPPPAGDGDGLPGAGMLLLPALLALSLSLFGWLGSRRAKTVKV